MPDSPTETGANPYDLVPYGGLAVPASHPDVLALAGRRHGVSVAWPAGARVLEIGCAEGANLLPIAFRMPDTRCVGLDASAVQLEVAREARDRLGLDNLELIHARIEEVDPSALGTFDYVICHGVLSWVSDVVRERLWALIGAVLAPGGVAFVSFNCTPGWAIRSEIRWALGRFARGAEAPETMDRARKVLATFVASPGAELPYGGLLAEEARRLIDHRDAYLRHEYLAEHNRTFRWGEAVGEAGLHGLAPLEELGRAAARESERALIDGLREELGGECEAQEMAELLLFRAFRMMTFARADAQQTPSPDIAAELHWSGSLHPVSQRPSLDPGVSEELTTDEGERMASADPWLKAALFELARSWPQTVAFPALVARAQAVLELRRIQPVGRAVDPERVERLAADLLELARLGYVDSRSTPVTAVASSPTPRVSALTRWEAGRRAGVTSAHHRVAALDPLSRALTRLLDGSRGRDELVEAAVGMVEDGSVVLRSEDGEPLDERERSAIIPDLVDRSIAELARAGLLDG